jgi:integrase
MTGDIALVLLAAFASLRWGEATALRRCDLDLESGAARVHAVFIERSTGEMLLGPPKSRAGRRVVGIPDAIIPAVREHLAVYTGAKPGSLVFPGGQGRPAAARELQQDVQLAGSGLDYWRGRPALSRSSPHRESPRRCKRRRVAGLDGPDGHDSERAAIIYQHRARGADELITTAIEAHIQAEQTRRAGDDQSDAGSIWRGR